MSHSDLLSPAGCLDLYKVYNRTVVSYFMTGVNHALPRGSDPLMFPVVSSTFLLNLQTQRTAPPLNTRP